MYYVTMIPKFDTTKLENQINRIRGKLSEGLINQSKKTALSTLKWGSASAVTALGLAFYGLRDKVVAVDEAMQNALGTAGKFEDVSKAFGVSSGEVALTTSALASEGLETGQANKFIARILKESGKGGVLEDLKDMSLVQKIGALQNAYKKALAENDKKGLAFFSELVGKAGIGIEVLSADISQDTQDIIKKSGFKDKKSIEKKLTKDISKGAILDRERQIAESALNLRKFMSYTGVANEKNTVEALRLEEETYKKQLETLKNFDELTKGAIGQQKAINEVMVRLEKLVVYAVDKIDKASKSNIISRFIN